jgi:hypothetical protein
MNRTIKPILLGVGVLVEMCLAFLEERELMWTLLFVKAPGRLGCCQSKSDAVRIKLPMAGATFGFSEGFGLTSTRREPADPGQQASLCSIPK